MSEQRDIRIRVPVLARVEGEGALNLTIHDGDIEQLQLQIYEPPRYFEKFLEGRSYTEVPDMVARICGICPVAYQMSAVHAIEQAFGVDPGPWVRDMRRLLYCGEWIQSHALHIHLLALPDFLGFDSVTGMAAEHAEEVRRGLRLQQLGNDIIALLGARSVHPVGSRVGGFHHAPDQAAVDALLPRVARGVEEAAALLRWCAGIALPDDHQAFTSVALRHPAEYPMNRGRLVASDGLDIDIADFDDHFEEQHVPHSTALHARYHDRPYLVGPLARINLDADRLRPEVRQLLVETGVRFPSDNMFHSLLARAVEIHESLLEARDLLAAYRHTDRPWVPVTPRAGVGFGCTEAPRGVLWHRYELDEAGRVVTARIVPPTSQNQGRIEQDLRDSLLAFGLDHDDAALRLRAETVIRNYDPCISCATHFLRLEVERR